MKLSKIFGSFIFFSYICIKKEELIKLISYDKRIRGKTEDEEN